MAFFSPSSSIYLLYPPSNSSSLLHLCSTIHQSCTSLATPVFILSLLCPPSLRFFNSCWFASVTADPSLPRAKSSPSVSHRDPKSLTCAHAHNKHRSLCDSRLSPSNRERERTQTQLLTVGSHCISLYHCILCQLNVL